MPRLRRGRRWASLTSGPGLVERHGESSEDGQVGQVGVEPYPFEVADSEGQERPFVLRAGAPGVRASRDGFRETGLSDRRVEKELAAVAALCPAPGERPEIGAVTRPVPVAARIGNSDGRRRAFMSAFGFHDGSGCLPERACQGDNPRARVQFGLTDVDQEPGEGEQAGLRRVGDLDDDPDPRR